MTQSADRQIAKNASVVAAATLLSRILGFIRDAVVAATLGAGLGADAFFVAFRVPNVLRRLFAEGSMTMSFIPVFQRRKAELGQETAFVMARSTLLWLVAVVGAVVVLGEVFAGPLTRIIAPGFGNNPGQLEMATNLLRICFPYILLISGVGLCMGVLNSLGHFTAPALSPVVLNVALIAAALLGWRLGLDVAHCLAWGVLAGGALQWLSQLPALRARGFTWRGERSWRDPGVKRMGRLMLPTVVGAAVYQLNILLGTLLASFLPVGSISYLYYADRLVEFPLGVFGLAVSTAALPSLSALAATGKDREFGSVLSSTMRLTLFISLPAMAGLIALAEPIVGLLFGRGRFDPQDVAATSMALRAFALGLPFAALARPLASAFYARENTRTPVLVAAVCMVVNVGLGALLMRFLAHVGLALAVSASSAVNFAALAWIMRGHVGNLLPWPTLARMLGLSALVFLGALATAGAPVWVWLGGIPFWIALYVLGGRLLGMDEARLFTGMLRSRLPRRAGGA